LPLITTSSGEKMGKTAKGAVWLDSARTAPYEFYQYWINTDDQDVERFMALYTFLPMDEIRAIGNFDEVDLNCAKAVLAFEVTQLVHGREEAIKAYNASANVFGVRAVSEKILPSSNIPTSISALDDASVPHSYININQLKEGIPAFKLFHAVGLADTSSSSRRLIAQGGAYLNSERLESFDYLITDSDVDNMEILLRAGKKRFHKLKVKNND